MHSRTFNGMIKNIISGFLGFLFVVSIAYYIAPDTTTWVLNSTLNLVMNMAGKGDGIVKVS